METLLDIVNWSKFFISLYAFFIAVLCGITLVGMCKFSKTYELIFGITNRMSFPELVAHKLKFPFKYLEAFIGENIGFAKDINKTKGHFFGYYLEHLIVLYLGTSLVIFIALKPEKGGEFNVPIPLLIAAIITLLSINIGMDAFSLLYTKKCYKQIITNRMNMSATEVLLVFCRDICVATLCFLFTQLMSNGLYSVQTGNPELFFSYMFSIDTAFEPYVVRNEQFPGTSIPGQLIISMTSYLPTLLLGAYFILLSLPYFAYKTLIVINSFLNSGAPFECSRKVVWQLSIALLGLLITSMEGISNSIKALFIA